MTQTASTTGSGPRRRHRISGGLLMTLGVVGIVVCLLLAAGAFLARGALFDRIDSLVAGADAGLARADQMVGEVEARLIPAGQEVAAIQTELAAIQSGTQTEPGPLLVALDAATGGSLSDLRSRTQALRERLASVADTVERIRSALPNVGATDVPVTEVEAASDGVEDSAGTIFAVPGRLRSGDLAASAATTVLEGPVARVDAIITDLTTMASNVSVRIDTARVNLASGLDRADFLLTVLGIAVIGLFLYLAFLHAVLFVVGRRRWRGGDAATG